ncbi:MAG: hypothetical protein JXB85_01000 [Anaerolineales bacterium]|nr:hypothetical protein [Anaerolineales bacterium]
MYHLSPGQDDDPIALVLTAKKLAPAIREAMRSRVLKETFTEQDLNQNDLEAVGIDL